MINISKKFRRLEAPDTNREVVQLTSGDTFCYPLYYFIPSIKNNYLIYHQANESQIQLYRLDLTTGENVQLTYATASDTQWWPWCTEVGKGVLDHRSVLNYARNEVIYFNGNDVHSVHIKNLNDRVLFTIPEDRKATGQNCISPNGKWFVYIDHDRNLYDEVHPVNQKRSRRYLSRGTTLSAYNIDTQEHKTLIRINSPIHHVQPLGDDYLLFSSPATEKGILLTNYEGGWYTHNRTQDENEGTTCHYCGTNRGIHYEVTGNSQGILGGIYNPHDHQKVEFLLPSGIGGVHAGFDPEGKIWFYESKVDNSDFRQMHLLFKYKGFSNNKWIKLSGKWPMYWPGFSNGHKPLRGCQKAHHHPRVTPDRKWITFTAGDSLTETNHIFLLDISDIDNSIGLPEFDYS